MKWKGWDSFKTVLYNKNNEKIMKNKFLYCTSIKDFNIESKELNNC